MKIYALDIGGTSIKHAVIDTKRWPNPIVTRKKTVHHGVNSFDALKERVLSIINDEMLSGEDFTNVAISTTGGVDREGRVMSSGFFSGYGGKSWKEILSPRYSNLESVFTINDGRASAWAEYLSCSTKPSVFVHFVLGTGIGGSTIIDGKLITGEYGAAGYLGHIKVSFDSTDVCSCGKTGCVETFSSGPSIIRAYTKAKGLFEDRHQPTLKGIVSGYSSGDDVAIACVNNAADKLGLAVSDIMNVLNPGVITIGGGVALALADIGNYVFLNKVKSSALNRAHKKVQDTEIKIATLGNDAGMIGAAMAAEKALSGE